MRTLYHIWLSPFSRKVRIVLKEKQLEFEMQVERVWERRRAFLAMNPAGQVPVLVEEDGTALADSDAICEYLDEVYPDPSLLGAGHHLRAEVRRLTAWFDTKFYREVTINLEGGKSRFAQRLLNDWEQVFLHFWQVVPKEMVDRLEHPTVLEEEQARA